MFFSLKLEDGEWWHLPNWRYVRHAIRLAKQDGLSLQIKRVRGRYRDQFPDFPNLL